MMKNNVNVLVETDKLTTKEWLEYRTKGIGGSDVAAILGISKWSSAIEIWLEKTGQTLPEESDNDVLYFGRTLEPVIRNEFAKRTGKKVIEIHAILQNEDNPFMLANIDGLTEDENGNPAIFEAKCVSEFKRSEWEDEDIPYYYQTQVQHYLAVTGLDKAYVAALIGSNSFVIKEVEADYEIQKMLIQYERDFWINNVLGMVRPQADGSDACTELLSRMFKGGMNEEIILPDDVVDAVDKYLEGSAMEDSGKALKAESANRIKEVMGDYNNARCLKHIIRWTPVTSQRLDTKALQAEEPEIYEKYLRSSVSRRFSVR